MKFTLKQKIIGLTLFATVLPVLIIGIMITVQKDNASAKLREELDLISRSNLTQIALDVSRPVCNSQ